jgi:hypothetical protein
MNPLPKPLAHAIIGLVTLVWAINFGAQFFVEGYKSDPLIHGIFMGIIGGTLALTRKTPAGPPPPDAPEPPQVTPEGKEGAS